MLNSTEPVRSPEQQCEGFTQHRAQGASADNYLSLKSIKRIETRGQVFFDEMCNYRDVQKKVIPAFRAGWYWLGFCWIFISVDVRKWLSQLIRSLTEFLEPLTFISQGTY